jgi:uncharacterized repeat protein (TIGR01451 family)
MSRFALSLASLFLMAAPAPSFAEAKVSAELKIEKLEAVTRDGAQIMIVAENQAKLPGDVLRYTISIANSGADAADNVVINYPVPAEVRYDGDATTPVSVDGGKTFGPIGTLLVTAMISNGVMAARPATFADVTHVRWDLGSVKPASRVSVSFQGVLK